MLSESVKVLTEPAYADLMYYLFKEAESIDVDFTNMTNVDIDRHCTGLADERLARAKTCHDQPKPAMTVCYVDADF